MRYTLLLSLLTAIAAAYALVSLDRPSEPLAALNRDPANPYRWAEYAEAQAEARNLTAAQKAFQRALSLSPNIPQIYLRHANFLFGLNQPEAALPSAAQALRQVPDFDAAIFSSFTRFNPPSAAILKAIGDDRRAVRSYTEYLSRINDLEHAATFWAYCNSKKFNDDALTIVYTDALLRNKRFDAARATWFSYKKASGLLFNPGFEAVPTGSVLDWRIIPSGEFETTLDAGRSGKRAVRIEFKGTTNAAYANLVQQVVLNPGTYSLTAWVKTENITTNEGIRLEANGQQSEAVNGTHRWSPVTLRFNVAATAPVTVRAMRNPSQKFDNKISGTVWLDDLELTQ